MATKQFRNRSGSFQKIQVFKTKRAILGKVKKKNPDEPFKNLEIIRERFP